MEKFIHRFADKIIGTLSGFDRLVIRGTLRGIATHTGMREFLWQSGVLMKDFKMYAQEVTKSFREQLHEIARKENRPFVYLPSSRTNKEQVALQILKEHPVKTGLISIITCVEPCRSFTIVKDRASKKIRIHCGEKMCLHAYQYRIDPVFGFMNGRIQTWFPFNIQLCINGREWLSRQMDRIGMKYRRLDNCFPWIEDIGQAQALMDHQLKINWSATLDPIASLLNPTHNEIFSSVPMKYYWTTPETEWATDIMFKDPSDLAPLYKAFVSHAISSFASSDVMRFLGRKLVPHFHSELTSDYKKRLEGTRIKHQAGMNSVKAYDKFQIILRVESTFNNPRDFKVFRPLENQPGRPLAYQRLRQGIADLFRRAQVSQACNARYLDALALVDSSTPLGTLIEDISRPVIWQGKRVRALRPYDPQDLLLFQAVTDGKFSISGFRNRDLQALLYNNSPDSQKQKRQRSSHVSRLLRILRAHHLVKKIPQTYRYLLTPKGAETLRAILSLRTISLDTFKRLTA